MLTSLIFFIVAFISFQMFSGLDPYPGWYTVVGTLTLFCFAWFVGLLRIKQLLRLLKRTGNPEDPRLLRMFMQWKTVFQFTVIIMYVSSLTLFRWGSFVNQTLGLKRWVLLDELIGLLPYFGFLLLFWSLSYHFQNKVSREKWTYWGFIEFNIHLALTPVAPLFFYVALMDSLYYLPAPLNLWFGYGGGVGDFLLAFLFLGIVGFVFPLFLVKFWKCRSMEPGEKRYLLESVCRAKGLKYRDILIWDIGEGKFLNAAVLGISSHFRYILFTRKLLDVMTERELIAVLGHEVGHAKKHHILMNVFISFGFLSFFMVATELITLQLAEAFPEIAWFISFAGTIGLVVLYWRVIFGFISRRFEREADLYGAEVAGGVEPMISALEKLAVLSGRPRDIPDWTHYSIAERVDFLIRTADDPVAKVRYNLGTSSMMKKFMGASAAMFLTALILIVSSGAAGGDFPLDRMFEQEEYGLIEEHLLGKLEGEFESRAEKAEHCNNLAWLYATSNDSNYRKPGKALSLAEEAVSIIEGYLEQAASNKERLKAVYLLAIYTDTLAAAHFALGDNYKALEYSERAIKLFPKSVPGIEDLIKAYEKHKQAVERGDTYI